MIAKRWLGTAVCASALLALLMVVNFRAEPVAAEPVTADYRTAPAPAEAATPADDAWMTRTVWACDRRKAVVVEGVNPNEKLPPAKAQLVADLLMDLMRHCNEEITARISRNELIRVSVNGMPYQDYTIGGDLPIVLTHQGKVHSEREQKIWKVQLDRMVEKGDQLFHSDDLGTNGIACAMCHPNAANTHPETYPKFQTQLKKVVLLRQMINWCIENPLEGPPLKEDDERMVALEAYILSQRQGVPIDVGKH